MWRLQSRETAQSLGPGRRIWRGDLPDPDCLGLDWVQSAKAVQKARNAREAGHRPAAIQRHATKRNWGPRSVKQPVQARERHFAQSGRSGTHSLEVRMRPPSTLRLRPKCDLVLRKFPGDQRSRVPLQYTLITYSRPFPAQFTVTRSVVRREMAHESAGLRACACVLRVCPAG